MPHCGDVTTWYGRYFSHTQQEAHRDDGEADDSEVELLATLAAMCPSMRGVPQTGAGAGW